MFLQNLATVVTRPSDVYECNQCKAPGTKFQAGDQALRLQVDPRTSAGKGAGLRGLRQESSLRTKKVPCVVLLAMS